MKEAAAAAPAPDRALPKGLQIHNRRSDQLRVECVAFSRYLTGNAPDGYVLRKYVDAHKQLHALRDHRLDAVDRALLGLARRGGILTEVADSYARFFRKGGPLRSKLIVLLSILESAPHTHSSLNSAVTGRHPLIILSLCGWVIRGVLCLGAGLVLVGPVHAAVALGSRFGSSRPDMSAP